MLKGEQHPAHRLTAAGVADIRKTYRPGVVTMVELAELFGVSKQSIWRVVHHQTWKHVEP